MDLLLQEDGEKELTTQLKPLRALGYTGSTGGSSGQGGCGLSCPWPPVEASVGKLRPPAPPLLSLWRPLSPTVAPEKVWSHP